MICRSIRHIFRNSYYAFLINGVISGPLDFGETADHTLTHFLFAFAMNVSNLFWKHIEEIPRRLREGSFILSKSVMFDYVVPY